MSSERRKPYPFDLIEPEVAGPLGRASHVRGPESRRRRLRRHAAKVLRPRHVPLPQRRGPARGPSGGLHGHGHRGPLQADARASTSSTRWAGTPSACRPSNTPSRPASIPPSPRGAISSVFKAQLKRIGFAYDWTREINTTDPAYYRWTQWIFLKLYNSWFNPATRKAEPIETYRGATTWITCAWPTSPRRWSTGARRSGPSWPTRRSSTARARSAAIPVERRPMRQWMLRITAYAQRLIDELDGPGLARVDQAAAAQLDRPQRRRGGPFPGRRISASVITVFTTRPDTLFGATYMVLAPEHQLVEEITTEEQWPAVRDYREKTARKSDLERTDLAKEKTGVFTGGYAHQSGQRRAHPDLDRRLRAARLRHRRDHGRARAR